MRLEFGVISILFVSLNYFYVSAEEDAEIFQQPWTDTYIGTTVVKQGDGELTGKGIYESDTKTELPGQGDNDGEKYKLANEDIIENKVLCGIIDDIDEFDMSKDRQKLCNFVYRAPDAASSKYVERLATTILEIEVQIPNQHVHSTQTTDDKPEGFTKKTIYAKFAYTKPVADSNVSGLKYYEFKDDNKDYSRDCSVAKKPRIFIDQRFVGLCNKWCHKNEDSAVDTVEYLSSGSSDGDRSNVVNNDNLILCYEGDGIDCNSDTITGSNATGSEYYFKFGDTAVNIRGSTKKALNVCTAAANFGATTPSSCPNAVKKLSQNAFKAKFRKHKFSPLYTVFTNFTSPTSAWPDGLKQSSAYVSHIKNAEPKTYRTPKNCKEVPSISTRQRMGFAGTHADISRSVPILFKGNKDDEEQMKEMCGKCVIIKLLAPSNFPFGHQTAPAEFKFYGHFYDTIEAADLSDDMKDDYGASEGGSVDAVGLNIDFIIPFEQLANGINNGCAQQCYGTDDVEVDSGKYGNVKKNNTVTYCDQIGTTECGYKMDRVLPNTPSDEIYRNKEPTWNQAVSSFALFGEEKNDSDKPNKAWSSWWKDGWLTKIEYCDGCTGDLPPLY